MSLSDWLKLNVGGKAFLTTRSTLSCCTDSTLSKMFDPNSGLPPAYSEDGVYFLDADPDCFNVILNWLRHRKVMVNPGIDINNVREVADFFGLVELCQMINTMEKDSLLFVKGTWVTRGPVLPAMTVDYACVRYSRYVFSRMKGNRLALVPSENRQETLVVDVKDSEVGWVATMRGCMETKAVEYLEASARFQLDDLKSICEELLIKSLDKNNAGELLIWAVTCHAKELKKMSLLELMNNRHALGDGWLEEMVGKGAPREALEIIEACRNEVVDNK